jgi:hypothetical protein
MQAFNWLGEAHPNYRRQSTLFILSAILNVSHIQQCPYGNNQGKKFTEISGHHGQTNLT